MDLALACGVGDIALGACIMAMPIVQRPSCLTCPGTRQALVLLSLVPLSRFGNNFETTSENTQTWSSTPTTSPTCSRPILVKMLPFSSLIAQSSYSYKAGEAAFEVQAVR